VLVSCLTYYSALKWWLTLPDTWCYIPEAVILNCTVVWHVCVFCDLLNILFLCFVIEILIGDMMELNAAVRIHKAVTVIKFACFILIFPNKIYGWNINMMKLSLEEERVFQEEGD
jgi:hypothetical protein